MLSKVILFYNVSRDKSYDKICDILGVILLVFTKKQPLYVPIMFRLSIVYSRKSRTNVINPIM